MIRGLGRHLLTLLLVTLPLSALSQNDGSVERSLTLDSVTVKGYLDRSPLRTSESGVTTWDMNSLSLMPQILGNADPIHYAQMLPGIQTNSEYHSGIHIEGCEYQHNGIHIEGVPIYNVNHLLGFFSAFNAPHFQALSVAKGVVSAASSNNLGGQLNMHHQREIPDSTNGILSLGLISSQGTLRIPLSSRTALFTSLRASYLNLLYSKWLTIDEQQLNYTFSDINATLMHRLNARNTLLFDFYTGRDKASFSENDYMADLKARWGNIMGAAHWHYESADLHAHTTAYITSYKNRFSLQMPDMNFKLPSGITDVGVKNMTRWKQWSAGFEAIGHHIQPQSVEHQGQFNITDGHASSLNSFEGSLFLNYEYSLTPNLWTSTGIRGSIFRQGNSTYSAIDPSFRLLYDNHIMKFSATYALRHQYLFLTGFSDMGLPTEFWLSASENISPQYAHEFSVSGSTYFFRRRYSVTLDLFYRRLYHQLGYIGSALDFVNTIYDLNQSLMHGDGNSWGYSIMINKHSGPLTGWLGYTFTHARRSFDYDGRQRSYPASHERPHEFNAVMTYRLSPHWALGANVVYASGTPFTMAESLMLLNNNIVIKYGDYNGSRLEPYFRTDLSVNYQWNTRQHREHGFNFSLYNVTCHENKLFYHLSVREGPTFSYRPTSFFLRVLPSVRYCYKF